LWAGAVKPEDTRELSHITNRGAENGNEKLHRRGGKENGAEIRTRRQKVGQAGYLKEGGGRWLGSEKGNKWLRREPETALWVPLWKRRDIGEKRGWQGPHFAELVPKRTSRAL